MTSTLWSADAGVDRRMIEYTVGGDRHWDARLLRWDVLGSLGHAEGLRASRLLTEQEYVRLRRELRAALRAVGDGRLIIGPEHEDAHSAVELWLTARWREGGERLHAGRSRNDQVACDIRLYLKQTLLDLHGAAGMLAAELLAMGARYRGVLLPGYTHQRRAMPSSIALWAGAYAEGLIDTMESLPGLWARLDRSPLGSAAGYGVPLPLRREAAAKALGFAGLDANVAGVQNGRGKLEAATLFWCTQLGHDLSRLSADVILYTAEEFGYLVLPAELSTGSSIMPQKRNPDLFELTRARAAALDGDLFSVMHLSSKLTGGYHRDFQLLKEPLFRGLDRTGEMLRMLAAAAPRLGVDAARCEAALGGGTLATDEVMRLVELGQPFRSAYRDVAAAIKRGAQFAPPSRGEIVSRRRSTGGVGNPGLGAARSRLRAVTAWATRERRRFERAMNRLGRSRP